MKQGKVKIEFGKPIEIIEESEIIDIAENSDDSISKTFKEYRKILKELLTEKYSSKIDILPEYLRNSCNVYIFSCKEGIIIRYDFLDNNVNDKIIYSKINLSLSEFAPMLSDSVIHLITSENYILEHRGPAISLVKINSNQETEIISTNNIEYFIDFNKTKESYKVLNPPNKPIPYFSITNDLIVNIDGTTLENELNKKKVIKEEDFIAHGRGKLNVGWLGIEIFPLLNSKHWSPDFVRQWAELDINQFIAKNNTIKENLNLFDSRRQSRIKYTKLIKEFSFLLNGLEEPCHQFLKSNPEFLNPTHLSCWSKVKFGKTISDFVFMDSYNDYQLIEIEAPIRELFRKDGHQRHELTHAISQINDWIQYIQKNKEKAEIETGLSGLSTNPRTLVVIGRSINLTEENRKKIELIQSQNNKLRIMTYDDVLENAKVSIERLFGNLSLEEDSSNLEFYFKE